MRVTSVRTAALLYLIIAGALTQVPLFNYLGFEFSALLTIPVAFISGFLTIQFLDDHLTKPLTRRTWLYVVMDYLTVNGMLLLIPLAVISANALVVKNCSFTQGLAYYFLLPVCTMMFSVALAMLIRLFTKYSRLFFSFTVLLVLSQILFITYTEPQLFSYNFILGYFPGITYDEQLSDLTMLVLFREFTLLAALLCFVLFFLFVGAKKKYRWGIFFPVRIAIRQGDRMLWSVVALASFTLAFGHFSRHSLHIMHTAEDIQQGLGKRTESEHFIFYYSKDSYSAEQARVIKAEAEFHYRKVIERLHERLPEKKKISLYIYPSSAAKKTYIGTANTNIAKPWRREIHLTADSFEETFRHELVHVVAGNFGLPIVNASARMAMNEGVAVAIDWSNETFSPHTYCAALLRDSAMSSIEPLFSYTGFATQHSTLAYTVAGSFSKYIIDKHGIELFKKVFATGNFMTAYGTSLSSLVGEWKQFLATIDCSAIPVSTVRTMFLQQSIFRKTCARVTAQRNANALQAIRVKNYVQAEQEFSASFDDAPTAFALRGVMQSLLAQKKYDEAIQRYNQLDKHSMLKENPVILLLLGDALWGAGKNSEAQIMYSEIQALQYSSAFTETAALRNELCSALKTNHFLEWYAYGSASDSLRIAELQQAMNESRGQMQFLFQYLLAKEHYRQGHFERAGTLFANTAGFFEEPTLSFNALMHAGDSFYRAGLYEQAKAMYWQTKNYIQDSVAEEYVDERIALCDFVLTTMSE